MNKVEELIHFLQKDELLQCALTEAIHRFYYSSGFDTYTQRPAIDSRRISHLHTTMMCLHPDWRYRIKKHMARYADGDKVNYLPLINKPPETTTITMDFALKV